MNASVGIDVSKATLDVAITGQQRIIRLANTPTGWAELRGLLATLQQPLVVLEATNRYHEGVTAALQECGRMRYSGRDCQPPPYGRLSSGTRQAVEV